MKPGLPTASVVRSSQATPARRRGQPCISANQPAADPLISPQGRVQTSGATSVNIHLRARRFVFGFALLAGMASAATAAQAKVQTVHVIRVVDGDTVVVGTAESLNLKVRLQGIDAPECGMPFGPQAQRFL